MAWFKKARKPIAAAKDKSSRVPEGLWVKCAGCSQAIYHKELATTLNVCPKCGHHFRLTAVERHRLLLGRGADDGRRAVADADGENCRRARAARPRAAAVYLGTDRSDDGRRHGKLRDARRSEHRRAEGPDWVCRTAGHRTDNPP